MKVKVGQRVWVVGEYVPATVTHAARAPYTVMRLVTVAGVRRCHLRATKAHGGGRLNFFRLSDVSPVRPPDGTWT